MITLYTGTPGSGKSLHLMKVVLRNLKRGKHVIANFPVKLTEQEIKKGWDKRLHFVENKDFTIEMLIEFAIDNDFFEKKLEDQAMVIYDEAGGKFNSRDFNPFERMEWLDFFSQHRKCGFDFILVAQSDRMIDRQIRGMIETMKIHRKMNNYGPFVFLPIPFFVCIEQWYVAKERVSAEFFRYHKSWGNRYDSMKLFEGFKMSDALLEKIKAKEKKDKNSSTKADPVSSKGKNDEIVKVYKQEIAKDKTKEVNLKIPIAAVYKDTEDAS